MIDPTNGDNETNTPMHLLANFYPHLIQHCDSYGNVFFAPGYDRDYLYGVLKNQVTCSLGSDDKQAISEEIQKISNFSSTDLGDDYNKFYVLVCSHSCNFFLYLLLSLSSLLIIIHHALPILPLLLFFFSLSLSHSPLSFSHLLL